MNNYEFKDGFAPPEDGVNGNVEEHNNEATDENGNNDEEF